MTGSEFLVVAVLIGLLPALIAQSKGHNFLTWWVFGALMFIVGWYPDPDGNGTRYWNGFSWTTEHKPASSA